MTFKMAIERLRYILLLSLVLNSTISVAQPRWSIPFSIGTSSGRLSFTYNETPEALIDIHPPVSAGSPTLTYQWESTTLPYGGFSVIAGATQISYGFTAPLTATTYYRKKVTNASTGDYVYSNVVKMELVGSNWENRNYVREHSILKSGVTTWTAADALPIGEKLEATTYFDGLGRTVQNLSRGTATPPQPTGTWGDHVQFVVRDVYGRQPNRYLPYTTTTEAGKFKTTAVSEQQQYYSINYNDSYTYSSVTYDNSPLNRVVNSKAAGYSWANGAGNNTGYELNTTADAVHKFTIGYTTGAAPVDAGVYDPMELYKMTSADENGKQVIEYVTKAGQVILTKTQLNDNPAGAYEGWICRYNVYDEFNRLRYEIEPEAVEYLRLHNWSFAGPEGPDVLNGLCSRYEYDERGRMIIKKVPGAKEMRMLYDLRDRLVFTQDGNQSQQSPAEWTATLYDELDRPVLSTLYRTSKTVTQLQSDLDNAVILSTVNIVTPNQPIADLVVDHRDLSIVRYAAQNSIEITAADAAGFESSSSDDFVAEIDPSAVTTGYSITTAVLKNPITPADLNNSIVCTVLKYQFYDDYSFAGVKAFETGFQNTSAYSSSLPDVMPIIKTKRTLNYATGSLVRVLGTNNFLASTGYYDEDGRLIQNIEDNIKSGKDVATYQYHWTGRLLSVDRNHTTLNTGYISFDILTKNVFDKLGRVTEVMKKYGSNDLKTIATYEFDDIGRMKQKILAPGYTGTGNTKLETLTYTYNIHSSLTGINKAYALKEGGYDKWAHYFGLYLGYDNRDNVFAAGNLTGQATGVVWNSQGDDAQRRYDYSYDNAGRLSKAEFTERATTGDSWSNTQMDFSVRGNGTGGKISYDLNGNLQSMVQRGVLPGSQSATDIDNLQYTYASYSNKLMKVTDGASATIGNSNGAFGDFKDGANGAGNDYVYDDNGNLVIDLNKNMKELQGVAGANGIKYNYLDKPEEVRLAGKGTIRIVYDATGSKLQKIFTPEGSGTSKTTTYINEFVYEENSLQYINFEEGRIRVIQPVSQSNGYDGLSIDAELVLPGGKKGAVDYFIHDQQQNIRMVLTDETHVSVGTCTMEDARATNEEPVFGQPGGNNEVVATRYLKPSAWQANTSAKVAKLSKLTHPIGPNTLLKVMAGDELNASASYYYAAPVSNDGGSITSSILNTLVQAITGSSATSSVTKTQAQSIYTNLGGTTPLGNLLNQHQTLDDEQPRAYLTVLFFDERFNFVEEGSALVRTTEYGDGAAPLVLSYVKAPKNGYAFIYLSNENEQPVYFDDFQVSHKRGRIAEENHYYAFGLKIAAISSRKLGDVNEGRLQNQNQFQGEYNEFDDDLGWNDFALRNYDPQVGRFIQQDPYNQFSSPYTGMGNDPANVIDPSGGIGIPCPGLGGTGIFMEKAGEFVSNAMSAIGAISNAASIGSSVAGFASRTYSRSVEFSIVNRQLRGNTTLQVGVASRKDKESYWIYYDGQYVTIYEGAYGDTKNSKVYKRYGGTSGGERYQNSRNQNIPDVGPVPTGDYAINLKPSFTRKAKTNSDGSTKPTTGVELLPWDNGVLYDGWGQWRARLDKVDVKNSRDFFYFHDSYKGYSHGCIETETSLYYDLAKFKNQGLRTVKVKIIYVDNITTNGGTKRNPPPWTDHFIEGTDGKKHPVPRSGSFPDPSKI